MKLLSKHQLHLFKTLTELYAISGLENEVASFLKTTYEKLGYPIITDQMGSIFAYKKSKTLNAKKVMIVGHMDEVGFIVHSILDNGMVKAHPIGGINEQTLLSSRVVLKGKKGYLKGCIGAIPPHLMTKQDLERPTQMKDMLFDFGMTSKQEAEEAGIFMGAMMVVEGKFEVLNGGKRLLGKAFDDRYGIVLGIEILEALKDVELPYDLYVGGSVQEEVGCRGAFTSSYKIHPDLAIVLDCSPAKDATGDTSELGVLGNGVLYRVMDRTMIAFPEWIEFQQKCVKKSHAKGQYYISPGGTDAGSIHKQFDGIPTLTHCLVARNIHTCSTILDAEDYLSSKKSLLYMLKHMDMDLLSCLRRNKA